MLAHTISNGVSGPLVDRLGTRLGYALSMAVWLSGRMIDNYGYVPVFIGYGVMPLVALPLVLFALGPLRPLPEFQPVPPKIIA